MDASVLNWFTLDHGFNAYVTLFVLLLLGAFGFPIPEDIPLVLGGVAASRGVVSLEPVLLVCYVGVLLADVIIYLIGFRYGQRILSWGVQSPFFPSLTEERVGTIRDGLRKRRFLYILIGRHFFPVRTATFLTAGTVGIPFLEFLVADAIAALLSVTLVVGLGFWLGGSLSPDVISHLVHQSNFYIGGIIVLGALSYLIGVRWKQRHRHSAQQPPYPLQSAQPQQDAS